MSSPATLVTAIPPDGLSPLFLAFLWSCASAFTRFGYRVIAPSRFGYLRTPTREDASPMLEADTWIALLDALQVDRVFVMSWSAGAAPAAQLALRRGSAVNIGSDARTAGARRARRHHHADDFWPRIDRFFRESLPEGDRP